MSPSDLSRALRLALPLAAAGLALAALGLAAFAAPALAGPRSEKAKLQRGGLPSIGAIALKRTAKRRAEVTVPVTYTKALTGPPTKLESAVVTLHVGARLKRGRPLGTAVERSRSHRLDGSSTVNYRFGLNPRKSRWLLGKRRGARARLVRVDVRHLIRKRQGERPLHEKAASLTMASSHRARAQGASGELTLVNRTTEPIDTVSMPIVCMYAYGEEGSNPQAFTTTGLPPGGTIEAEIEADGSILDDAEYEGTRGASAGVGVDALGIAADVIGDAFEVELGPILALIEVADHCESMASVFSIVAANAPGTAASSEAWVLTDETCRYGCPHQRLISAYEALGFQSPGIENGSEIWASESTGVLEGFAGFYYPTAPTKGQIVQDVGLHFEWDEYSDHRWEVSVGEGSKPAGFSG